MIDNALIQGAWRLVQEFRRALFLDFQPQQIPVLVFDGTRTWLHGASPTEAGWQAAGTAFVWEGRYPLLVAHTAVALPGGVHAAGICGLSDFQDAAHLASVMVHEGFHVWQRQQGNSIFAANELDALTYPRDKGAILHARSEETHALALALISNDWHRHTQTALAWRAVRHSSLSPEHVTLERELERLEGLAHYVETAFLGHFPVLDAKAAASQSARLWCYGSGAALAHLLSRTGSAWQTAVLNGESLDELLAQAVGNMATLAPNSELQTIALDAVTEHQNTVQQALTQFEAQPGGQLRLRFARPPQVSFDPMNILPLPDGAFLHRRFLRLEGQGFTIQVIGAAALTKGTSLLAPNELHLTGLPGLPWSENTLNFKNDVYTIEIQQSAQAELLF